MNPGDFFFPYLGGIESGVVFVHEQDGKALQGKLSSITLHAD